MTRMTTRTTTTENRPCSGIDTGTPAPRVGVPVIVPFVSRLRLTHRASERYPSLDDASASRARSAGRHLAVVPSRHRCPRASGLVGQRRGSSRIGVHVWTRRGRCVCPMHRHNPAGEPSSDCSMQAVNQTGTAVLTALVGSAGLMPESTPSLLAPLPSVNLSPAEVNVRGERPVPPDPPPPRA